MIEIYITDDINKINFKILGIFELEMRPGKQLFPLNYNNIINDKNIKYNIKAIKLIIRETYGGNRTYINQIMFFEQSAEEVKDLLCSNDLNKIYKLNKKLLNNSNNNNSKNINNRKKNSLKEKNIKNKTFEDKQEESDIYKTSDIKNGKENKEIEITPITKKPFRQIKTDIKNSGKNKLKREKLEISLNKENDKKDNLTPNKYLKRIKSLNKGNNTSNYSKYNHNIQFTKNFGFNLKDGNSHVKQNLENNSIFNSSLNTNSRINSKNEKDNIMNSNEYENENENTNNFEDEEMIEEKQIINSSQFENNNSQYINGQNNANNNFNNKMNFENIEDNISNISENRQKMYKTHQNINYNQRPNIFFPNLINFKSNNNSNIQTEQNKNEISINSNNNNFSQRYSMISINDNYNNMKKQKINNIKQKLDYLEGNILEIKKTLQEISQGFAFCASKEFIINNFREQILSICEEIYNEYYPNNNYIINENDNDNNNNDNDNYVVNEQNGNESLMTNSNYISQNETNNNNQLEKDLENQINQKLDEKLGTLQNNIFDKYLKPTINKIGDSMNKYIEQIQLEVDNINDKPNLNNINTASKNDLGSKLSTSKISNQKFEEINKIGERLYNKLKEKEEKLKLLKQEKAKFLNERNEDD